jgi:hypothetical protein
MNYNKVKPGDVVPCKKCGYEFEARHYHQCYCSEECRREVYLKNMSLRNNNRKITDSVKSEIERKERYAIWAKDGIDYNQVKPGDEVPCNYCGKNFIATHYSQHYCSHECAKGGPRIYSYMYVCAYCGKQFEAAQKRKYCCVKCRSKAWNSRREKGGICVCKNCGVQFDTEHRRKFCTTSCKREFHKAQKLHRAENIGAYVYTKKCRQCGKEWQSDTRWSHFCSTECFKRSVAIKKYYRELGNLLYILGYEVDGMYAIKIGISCGKNQTHRMDQLRTGNYRLLNTYYIKSFDTKEQAAAYENTLLDETYKYRTEADNEWRLVDINTLIDLCGNDNEVYSTPGVQQSLNQ